MTHKTIQVQKNINSANTLPNNTLERDALIQKVMGVRNAAECLATPAEVDAAYDRMAQEITTHLSLSCPHFLVVLSGGMVPAIKLMSRLDFPLTMDYIHVSRYQDAFVGGEIELRVRPQQPLKNRTVVIVDDILDEGITLSEVQTYCCLFGATEVFTAVMVDKQHARRSAAIKADFVGLQLSDRFLFGEGMDYQGYFRNLNGIYAVGSNENG